MVQMSFYHQTFTPARFEYLLDRPGWFSVFSECWLIDLQGKMKHLEKKKTKGIEHNRAGDIAVALKSCILVIEIYSVILQKLYLDWSPEVIFWNPLPVEEYLL